MAHYLVTGAAGFIGARTSEMLIEQGHTVVGVDNLNDAYDVRIKEFRLHKLQALNGFQFVRDDISDREILNRQSPITDRPFDAVINLAARAGVRYSVSDPWTFLNSNVLGTLNMLELCRQTGCKKFLLASTSSIYGANPPYPTPETASSSEPLQPYAASKKGAEVLAHSYHYLHNIDVSVVRYFTVYGPAGRPDLAMFRFVQWISEGRPVLVNGDGKQSRGFTYVDDIARGTIAALKPLGFEIVNLGGHEVISINDLIKLTEEVVGKPAQVQYGPPNLADMFQNWADVSKARQLLDWQPQVGLREGMGKLVEWYRAEREWAKDIVTA
ncbi:MAG: NAD-dependent epimerase [Anaerolineaceae bacterium]|nr:NAD-dependent epimerase/dehydratase family protein [Anaerolineae bacterium]MBL1172304.1 NAD-dependent epimerase/dehydratase family protein [Chloroflexota bacterium]MDL1927198.1 NAD-dependent epimerase/dehydratase family protein [Anaerolineae bacterium AMX1]WKZ53720.1 MAG: GDP-mannose 4,6-dehydratase [Anaerolineales bacterium]GJQ39830.1 MAG: NAD-dependent epimerase [Anaerolineaceae bacterium]